jgi:hypothetical protein
MTNAAPERLGGALRRRCGDAKAVREIIRCLKRYIAREIYHLLTTDRHNHRRHRALLQDHRSFGKIERFHRTLAPCEGTGRVNIPDQENVLAGGDPEPMVVEAECPDCGGLRYYEGAADDYIDETVWT